MLETLRQWIIRKQSFPQRGIIWVPHCEDENCDLGAAHYTCFVCLQDQIDYDLWWKMWETTYYTFHCPNCQAKLYYETNGG